MIVDENITLKYCHYLWQLLTDKEVVTR